MHLCVSKSIQSILSVYSYSYDKYWPAFNWLVCVIANHIELEQLECLRSEDTPRRLMITNTIESYWIPSQKMTKSKLQIWKISQNFKILNFETSITCDTPSEVAW